jgi:hypothetical protein
MARTCPTHPPPAVAERLVLFQHLDVLARLELQLIAVLGDERVDRSHDKHGEDGVRKCPSILFSASFWGILALPLETWSPYV